MSGKTYEQVMAEVAAEPKWTHTCRPPTSLRATNPDRWGPDVGWHEGDVWYCGCGRAWGVWGRTFWQQEWQRVERMDNLSAQRGLERPMS